MVNASRREFIRFGAATVVAGTSGLSTVSAQTSTDNGWQEADSPTEVTFNDVVETSKGPFVCGADGNVAARTQDGWELVVEYGPQAQSRPLTGIDVTDDGNAVWFVGGSGVIGEYNVETETLTNYSAPMEMTSTWEDCAVSGASGTDERLYFANGSGELLVGTRQDSGAIEYNDVIKPGGGSTIPGIDFNTRDEGHVCSTSQFVAETFDGGSSWEQIGIDFAGGAFFDIASVDKNDVNIAAGAGIVYRYDGFRWTPHVIDGDREAVRAVTRNDDDGLAAGANGKVYERESTGQWQQFETPVNVALNAISQGASYDVAVGKNGTIVERQTSEDDTTTANLFSLSIFDTIFSTDINGMQSSIISKETLPTKPLTVKNHKEGKWTNGLE